MGVKEVERERERANITNSSNIIGYQLGKFFTKHPIRRSGKHYTMMQLKCHTIIRRVTDF
jgi:hypothetical protein